MKRTGVIPAVMRGRTRADIVVCGPEGSGTRALAVNLHRLCEPVGKMVRHQSLPHGDWWWDAGAVRTEIPVVMVRRPDISTVAACNQGCTYTPEEAAAEWPRAIEILASLPGAIWVSYEAMTKHARVQLENICAELDVPFDERLIDVGDEWWPWRDENEKYGVDR